MAAIGTGSPLSTEERFQLLVDSVTDYAIYMLDAEGRIATWNAGARRFKGYEAEEVIGEHFSRFFTNEDREARLPWRALEIAAREGRFETEGWRVRKNGERFWAHAILDAIRSPAGELIGFAKITRDITDKRRSDQALYESEQRFRMLVQGVKDYAIFMLDKDGRITNWNAGAQTIKGYAEDEIVGEHFSRFYTEEDRAAGAPDGALETALREGRFETEALRVRKDGSHFWANVVIDPIFSETGEHIGFAKITRDITDRKRAEAELEETRAALAQAQKLQALGELTGGIAHDFNNLMTVIRGSAELMRRDDLPEEKRRRYLDAIIDTADRATTLTSHLLAFSRRQPLKSQVIDVNLRLDALAEVLSRALGSNVEVRLELAPGLWRVEADPAQLETALLNAAINARDAMPEGGRLTITTANVAGADGADLVCIALTDTGEGMTKEVLERAFEPFFTTKPVGKGTGLGLSQIHGFAAQTGGRAEIESEPGRGTTVRLLLPRTDKPLSSGDGDQAAPQLPAGLTVLLVEDNDQVRDFALHLLEDLGCTVVPAKDADEGLQALQCEPVDIVFSDVVMPGMSGIEMARLIHGRDPDLPIVLASGYSDEVVGGGAGDLQFVRKPYSRETLASALWNARAAVKPREAGAEA